MYGLVLIYLFHAFNYPYCISYAVVTGTQHLPCSDPFQIGAAYRSTALSESCKYLSASGCIASAVHKTIHHDRADKRAAIALHTAHSGTESCSECTQCVFIRRQNISIAQQHRLTAIASAVFKLYCFIFSVHNLLHAIICIISGKN